MLTSIFVKVALVLAMAALPSQADDGRMRHGMGVLLSPPGNYRMLNNPVNTDSLPFIVDLSYLLPPVPDQGPYPTCTLWAAGYGLKTLQEQREHDWGTQVPEHQFSPSFLYAVSAGCRQVQPMDVATAMQAIMNYGAATMAMFPVGTEWRCRQPSLSELTEAQKYRASEYGALFIGQGQTDIDVLRAYIAGGNGFVLALPVYSSMVDYHGYVCDEKPVIGLPNSTEKLWGNHAVLIIGYDDSLGAFKFMNSWGTRWGIRGFGYLSYEFVQNKAWEAWAMTDASDNEPIPCINRTVPGRR